MLVKRGSLAWLLVVAAALIAAAMALAVAELPSGGGHSKAAAATSNRVQGPPLRPATVVGSDGARVTCPSGSQPYVFINDAYFVPALKRGTLFVPGTYRIRMTGTVANETTSGIVIDQIRLHALTTIWRRAHVTAPHRLAANSSGRLTIVGTYRSHSVQQANVSATMGWHWQQRTLAACMSRGLIQDD
jgi:hypothetical protein